MSIPKSLVISFVNPIIVIGKACLWHPIVSISMLLIGTAAAWWACASFLFPTWLALSLSGLAILGALSLVPIVIEVFLPSQMMDKRMIGNSRFLFMGLFFFLFLLGTGCCLLFISSLWLGISMGALCFLLGFSLSTGLSALFSPALGNAPTRELYLPLPNVSPAKPKRFLNAPRVASKTLLNTRTEAHTIAADLDRKASDYPPYITELLAPEDYDDWLLGAPQGSPLQLMHAIASSYFTLPLPDGNSRPRGKDDARALACYQKIVEVGESVARTSRLVSRYFSDDEIYEKDMIAEAKLHIAILSGRKNPEEAYALLESAASIENTRVDKSQKKISILVTNDLRVVPLQYPLPHLPYPCVRAKVAEIYAQGKYGIPRNIERAVYWYNTLGQLSKAKELEKSEAKLALLMVGVKDEKSAVHAFFKDPDFDQNLLSLIFKTAGLSNLTKSEQSIELEERVTAAESDSKTPLLIYMANVEQLKKDVLQQKNTPEKEQLLQRIAVMEAGFENLTEQYLAQLIVSEDLAHWPKRSCKNLSELINIIGQIAKSYFSGEYPDKTPRSGKENPAYAVICYTELFELYKHSSLDQLRPSAGVIRYNIAMGYYGIFANLRVPQASEGDVDSKEVIPDLILRDNKLDKDTLYQIAQGRVCTDPYKNALLARQLFASAGKAFEEAAQIEPKLRENVAKFYAEGFPVPHSIERAIYWYRAAGNLEQVRELEKQQPIVAAKIQQLMGPSLKEGSKKTLHAPLASLTEGPSSSSSLFNI